MNKTPKSINTKLKNENPNLKEQIKYLKIQNSKLQNIIVKLEIEKFSLKNRITALEKEIKKPKKVVFGWEHDSSPVGPISPIIEKI